MKSKNSQTLNKNNGCRGAKHPRFKQVRLKFIHRVNPKFKKMLVSVEKLKNVV